MLVICFDALICYDRLTTCKHQHLAALNPTIKLVARVHRTLLKVLHPAVVAPALMRLYKWIHSVNGRYPSTDSSVVQIIWPDWCFLPSGWFQTDWCFLTASLALQLKRIESGSRLAIWAICFRMSFLVMMPSKRLWKKSNNRSYFELRQICDVYDGVLV